MKRLLPLLAATLAGAHPLGNFSVNHYTRVDLSTRGVDVTYVLDLAETPTYLYLRDRPELNGLEFRYGGKRVEPKVVRSDVQVSDKKARITSVLHLNFTEGKLEFEDHNFSERSGWKEIVIQGGEGVSVVRASHGETYLDSGNDLRGFMEWRPGPKIATEIVPIQQPPPVLDQTQQPATRGKGDYLSRLLGNKDIGLGLMLAGIGVAFGFGAAHALSPGHGKTIVAAYLVGSRGTMGHAAFLGAMVTFTHTISVFALGLATLFLSKWVVPQKIIPWLGAASGMAIVAIGASLFVKRLHKLRRHHHHHHPHHHSHVPEGDVTLGSLIALGASGGLVPCPSALVLLLSSIALGHVGFGLILLVAFSLGLAGVLMGIGMLVLYAKQWLPDPMKASQHRAFRLVPVLSAAVIVCLGLVMTGVSLVGRS